MQVICRPPARQSEAGRGRASRGMSGLEPRDGGCDVLRQRVEAAQRLRHRDYCQE